MTNQIPNQAGTKRCPCCGATKPTTEFYRIKNRAGARVPSSYCKVCRRARSRRERNPVRAHQLNLKRKYGMEAAEYEALYKKQHGCCAICGASESVTRRKLSVDHNHHTGAVRGLLCDNCNRAIGLLKDDPAVLHAAASYLENHNGT